MIVPRRPSPAAPAGRRTSRWLVHLIVGLLALLAAAACVLPRDQGRLLLADELLRDRILRLQAQPEPETRLTIIDIDESSIAAQGAWPWPREHMAELAETLLSHYRARGVAIDIVFPEAGNPNGDARLASLAQHTPLVLATVLNYERQALRINQGELPTPTALTASRPEWPAQSVAQANSFVANHATFKHAACVGNIGFLPDPDGALRRLPIFSSVNGIALPHLSLALLGCGAPPQPALAAAVSTLPNTAGYWRLPITRSTEAYTVIPAAAVLDRSAPADLLQNRWVIIGSTAFGLGDRVATPLARSTPGLLVHALATSALLDASETGQWHTWSGAPLALGWTLLSLLLLLWAIPRLPVWAGTGLLLLSATLWLGAVWLATALGGVVPASPPLLAYLIVLTLAIPYEWRLSQRESRSVLRMFSQYLSPAVIAELMRLGPDKHLQPALKEVTVLIADMEGYTPITSSLSLADAVDLTQNFLGCLTRPILEQGGTLDKYTGDGVVSFWGAPVPCADHADRAIQAGLQIVEQVAQANRQRIARGQQPVRVRVGIESGRALVGDLGTPFRSAYTAVGDCINFASKYQEAARHLPAQIIVGPRTRELAAAHPLRSLGSIAVRGAGQTLELFTPEPPHQTPPKTPPAPAAGDVFRVAVQRPPIVQGTQLR